MPPANGLFPGRYQILDTIGDGATSTLLLGDDRLSGQRVVIKCFKPEAKGAYVREMAAAFDLQHPNLVRCLGTFHRADGRACMVYEHLSGGSLAQLLAAAGRLPAAEVVACLRSLLRALAYLHGLGRIHCDLKPGNIMLRRNADGGSDYVLIDLGATCFLREAQEGRHVTGTPAYVAPERLKRRVHFNSDLYSLGVVAFEMSTGLRPFTGTVAELAHANLNQMPALGAITPPVLRDFIDHLLVKSPRLRWPGAELALAMLDKVAASAGRRPAPAPGLCGLHCLLANGRALAACVYPRHVDIVDGDGGLVRTLVTEQPIQLIDDGRLAYASPSRIQVVDLADGTETLLHEGLQQLRFWHVGAAGLVWGDCHYVHHQRRQGRGRFRLRGYLFAPKAALLADGAVAVTAGMANNDIVVRGEDGQLRQLWQLQNAVVALSADGDTLLAVTLNLGRPDAYILWRLGPGQAARHRLVVGAASEPVCANGLFFWLAANKALMCCDGDLHPKATGVFGDDMAMFAVSYRHRCLAVLRRRANGALGLTFTTDWQRT